MPIIKCKMCGGDIELSADRTFGTCEFCGSTMTLPKIDDEQRAAAFNRGNHFRRVGEFDKALAVYERIVQEDDSDAEAHWCCALCRFGIEYVEDPATYEWIPTCHRASFDSFLEDVDYLAAVAHSDGITRRQYQKDAAKIAEIQKGILATSQKEEPFDIFICYKESDENGDRTKDSLLAQEIYYQLTDAGYRVFFSRITLEDKAGAQYEPYIFAALNSAKIMVAVGTKAEHFNAVWVKNEWSRFLMLMKKDRTKLLLPCYRDMDPYDLPEQIAVLQSYDMGKIGFMQDLLRGIKKVLDSSKNPEVKETVIVERSGSASNNVTALLKRGNMALEDGDWAKADSFFEEVLNQDAENGEAYLGKFLAKQNCDCLERIVKLQLDNIKITSQNLQAGTANTEEERRICEKYAVPGYFPQEDIEKILAYDFTYRSTVDSWKEQLERIQSWLNSSKLYVRAIQYADSVQKQRLTIFENQILGTIRNSLAVAEQEELKCINLLQEGYIAHLTNAEAEVARMKLEAEKQKAVKEKLTAEKRIRTAKTAKIISAIVAIITVVAIVVTQVIIPANGYKNAEKFLLDKNYDAAITAFQELGSYKDSANRVLEAGYAKAEALVKVDSYEAAKAFGSLGNYRDAWERSSDLWSRIIQRDFISCSGEYAVGLKEDGTVAVAGNDGNGSINVSRWEDVIDIATGNFTLGLKEDGTVLISGKQSVRDVLDWSDIVSVDVGVSYAAGIKSDGTVVAAGVNRDGQCNVFNWDDIIDISLGYRHTLGLKVDGTVVAVGSDGSNQCRGVCEWINIVAVAAGSFHSVGLRADGTVVAIGDNSSGQCNVSEWNDIVAIAAGDNHTIGLKSDGTVVKTGRNDVSEWSDIVAISAGGYTSMGLKSDGTVVDNSSDQYMVSEWTDIKLPSN